MMVWKRITVVLPYILGIAVIVGSLGYYYSVRDTFTYDAWQVHHFDHADYRYTAEHFWGVEHNLETYNPEFSKEWGNFLTHVPFREIGVGTYYLVVRSFLDIVGKDVSDPAAVGPAITISLKILLSFAYLFFFVVCRRKFGVLQATLALLFLTIPPQNWLTTEGLLSEPFLRILFVCLAALAVMAIDKVRTAHVGAMFVCILLAAHIKSFWFLLAFLLLPALLVQICSKNRMRKYGAPILLSIAIPLSVFGVHMIGWGYPATSAGLILHSNLKTRSVVHISACKGAPDAIRQSGICSNYSQFDPYWRIYLGGEDVKTGILYLDKIAFRFSLFEFPMAALRYFVDGIFHATNFPVKTYGNTPYDSGYPELRLIDLVVFITLLFGLFRKRTLLLSGVGLSLWILPALSNVFVPYVTRYHRPMAGIPLVLAICVGVMVWKELQGKEMGGYTILFRNSPK